MRLAVAVQTLVGLALLMTTVAALAALSPSPSAFGYPWPPLSSRRLLVLLVLLSGSWLLCNQPTEGRVLLTVLPGRGLTVADLLVLPPLAVAAALLVREVLRRV